jgi:hypothetical protein
MIKIVSGTSSPEGSTVSLVNFCNALNSRGYECVFYGPDCWHLDKCKSGIVSDFSPEHGDIIVLHGIALQSISELGDIQTKIEKQRETKSGFSLLKDYIPKILPDSKNPSGFKLILTCQETERFPLRKVNCSLVYKIHYSHPGQLVYHRIKHDHFICPNFCEPLNPSRAKPNKTAGVIGTIRKGNRIEESIEEALRAGMECVTLFGYMSDPIYFYKVVEPLCRKYPGRIRYAGFIDNRQKIYDSISDVFSAVRKPWSLIERECRMTGTRFHGSDEFKGEFISNDHIFTIWKDQLGL